MFAQGKGSRSQTVTALWARSNQIISGLLRAFFVNRTAITSTLLRTGVLLVFTSLLALSSVLFVAVPKPAHAASASTLNFQARLLSNTGAVVPDGTYNIEFKLYDVVSGGSALWTDTRYDQNGVTAGLDYRVTVKYGYFSVALGDTTAGGTAFPGTINWDQEHWLSMNIGGDTQTATPTWDGEMTPRFKLTAVPFAFQAANALGVTSNNTSTAATNTNAVTVTTGNSSTSGNTGDLTIGTGNATSGISGNISIDAGTASGTKGTISLGAANASSLLLGRSGLTTTNVGNLTIQGGTATLGTTGQAGSLVVSDGSSNTATILVNATAGDYTFTIPTVTANDTFCLLTLANCSGSATTLQASYTADVDGSDAVIVLTAADGALVVRDAASTVTNLFTIEANGGTDYLAVTNTTITAGLDVVLAANKSLTVTGGATGSRPGSPTEGMVFYDTTTKQLITYSNGKWQSDRTGTTRIVSTTAASQLAQDSADYVANGENSAGAGTGTIDGDQVEINAALTAVGALGGGTVYLTEGTYQIDASISIPNNVMLTGAGAATIIQLGNFGATATNIDMIVNTDTTTGTKVKVTNILLDGRNDRNSNGTQQAIFFSNMGGGTGVSARSGTQITGMWVTRFRSTSISLSASSNSTISGIQMYNTSNLGNGIMLNTSNNSVISNNVIQGTSSASSGSAITAISSTGVTITGNTLEGNARGIELNSADRNTVSGNTITSGSNIAINLSTASNNVISNNKIHESFSTTDIYGIYLQSTSDNNFVTGNDITDSSCTTTCFAINVLSGTNNYLADNRYRMTAGTNQATIQDAGTGTRYASQMTPTQVLQSSSTLIKGNASGNITGTGAIAGSTTLTGTSTKFTTELQVGDKITVNAQTKTVMVITSDTVLTVDTAFSGTIGGQTINRQPAALLVRTSANANAVNIGAAGEATFKNGTDSTAAFQIQNAAATTLLNADTSNMRLGVNTTFTAMTTPAAPTTSVAAGGSLAASTTYFYKVTAVDGAGGETVASAEASRATDAVNRTINVFIANITGATGYKIYRSTTTNSEVLLTAVANIGTTTTFVDTGTITIGTATPPSTANAFTSVANYNTNQQLVVGGLGKSTGQVYIGGTLSAGPLSSSTLGFAPVDLKSQGKYVYVAGSSSFRVYDVTNPSVPILLSTTATSSISSIEAHGRYVYIYGVGNVFRIYDVLNPSAPVMVSTTNVPTSAGQEVIISGRYAYLADGITLYIYDISNPVTPVRLGSVRSGAGAGGVSMVLNGDYLYMSNGNLSNIKVYNISNPYLPTVANTISLTFTGASIAMQGNYLYFSGTNLGTPLFLIYDISNPTTPVSVGGANIAGSLGNNVVVSNRYAYTATSNNTVVIDITNPYLPLSVGTITGTGNYLHAVGRMLYGGNTTTSSLTISDLGGLYSQSIEAGTIETSSLNVNLSLSVVQNAFIGGALKVDQNTQLNGALGIAGTTLATGNFNVQTASNSRVAFNVSNSSNLGILNVDSTNGRVNIASLGIPSGVAVGAATAGGSLAVSTSYFVKVSAIDASGGESVASTEASGATTATNLTLPITWTATPGAVSYRIYFATASSAQVSYFTSTTNSYTFSTVAGATGGSVPTTSNASFIRLDGTNNIFQSKTNNTTALQVQTLAGFNILRVDTSTTSNLLTNPSIEVDTTNWVAKGTGATVSRVTTQQFSGLAALQTVTTGTANAGAAYNHTFAASTTYTFSLYLKASGANFSTINIGRQDVTGTDIDCLTGQTIVTTAWTRFTCSFTTGGTITSSNLYVKDTGTSHTFFIDGIQLETSATNLATAGASAFNSGGQLAFDGVISSPMSVAGQITSQSDLVAAGRATATTGTATAAAGTNTTTILLTAAGAFVNGDVIFIDNAGQDYYTRITAGGGSTTLTVSPAVNYDASVTIRKYVTQNIGASATDYTDLNQRFFQGYFLGGVVTGTGSTTLSDGLLTATTGLLIQTSSATAAGLTVNNGTSTGNILSLQDNGTNVFTVADGGAVTSTSNITLQGGTATLGTTSQAGSLVISDGSSNTGTLVVQATAGNFTYTIPTTTANDTFCLVTLANCAGGGSSKFTDSGAWTYLTSTTDELVIGSSSQFAGNKLTVVSTNSSDFSQSLDIESTNSGNGTTSLTSSATLTNTAVSSQSYNAYFGTSVNPASAVGTTSNFNGIESDMFVHGSGNLNSDTWVKNFAQYTELGDGTNADTIAMFHGFQSSSTVTANFNVTDLQSMVLYAPGISGTVTNNIGLVVDNRTGGTNNANMLIGSTSPPSGNWSIYNSSSYSNLFGGSIVANNSTAGVARTTEATARTNVTTVTITVAGYANGDVIFIDNAGQDYYTRITAGGGTTTLTVSPAVSYDVSASVTSWNVQNIGATSSDYTNQANRFFQGYFLGGIVTGAGSTTYSDASILSSSTSPGLVVTTQSTTAGALTVNNGTSTGNALSLITANTSGTQTAGLSIDRNGAGGTTTSLLSISNTAGTATNGILFTGTIGTDIMTAAGSGAGAGRTLFVSAGQGGVTGNGGAITLQGGLGGATSGNGGALSLQGGNATGGNSAGGNVSILSGTSTGTGAASTLSIASGSVTGTGIAGGLLTVTAGNGGPHTTGFAGDGGAITVTTGIGGAASGSGGGGNGGILTLQASAGGSAGGLGGGGNGGNVAILAGAGGLAGAAGVGGGGGGITLTAGAGGQQTTAAGAGGDISISGGLGGTGGTGSGGSVNISGGIGGTQSTGGHIRLTPGIGGSTNGTNGTVFIQNSSALAVKASGAGINAGSILTVTGVTGGVASATTGVTSGSGSAISLTTGTGGAATGATGANVGGAGGGFTLQAAAGGAVTSATGTSGVGGAISITAGAAGTGGATAVNGGTLTLTSGAGNLAGAGGLLSVVGGNGGATGTGAGITVTTGNGGATSGNSGVLNLQSGNVTSGTAGNVSLDVGTSTSGAPAINIGNSTNSIAKTITIGGTTQTGAITLGQSTATNTVNIATGNTATGNTQTINVGTGTPAGTGLTNINIGNSVNGGAVSVNSGTGNINLQAGGAATARVQIGAGGAGSATPDYLGLDIKSTTGDPAGGAEGYMYYNTFDNKFRCYQDTAWTDCIGAGGGGGGGTLQSDYTADADGGDAIIALTAADGGVLIRDAASPLTTAFAVQNNGGTANLLGVSSTAVVMQDSSGNNALYFDSVNSELRVYENVATPSRYLKMYYDTANNVAVYGASSGATQIGTGSGSGGNINLNLVGAATDTLNACKSGVTSCATGMTIAAAYTNSDFNFTRNVTVASFAVTGNVAKIEDLSGGITTGSSAPNVLLINQNNTSATGNLLLAQTGGATDVFKVSTAGVVTLKAGGSIVGAGSISLSSGGATTLALDTGGGAAFNLGTINATSITIGGNTAATLTQKVANSSTTAFTLQTAGATNILVADTTNSRLSIGTSDTTGTLLVLDTKTGAGDPTGVAGGMYYNSNAAKFRCYQGAAWSDCLSPWITIKKAADQDVTNSAALVDDNTLQFAVTAGTTYVVKFNICYTGNSAAGDHKGTFTFPTAVAAKNVSGRYITTTTADAIQTSGGVLGVATAFPTAAGLGMGTAAAFTDKRVFEGNFTYQANAAGTLRYQFAQNTATAATSARVCANSFIEYQAL